MGSLLLPLLLLLLSSPLLTTQAQAIKSSHLLDLFIRDYTLKSFNETLPTGSLYSVYFPAKFSSIRVNTARLRCGSLRRYGVGLDEFRLSPGVIAQPCAERVVIVTQSFGRNWLEIYYRNYDLFGYRLVSPVMGLLAYNVAVGAPFEIGLLAREGEPIRVNFTSVKVNATAALCVSFESNGKVRILVPNTVLVDRLIFSILIFSSFSRISGLGCRRKRMRASSFVDEFF